MFDLLINLILGMLPDVFYNWLFIVKIKEIKDKKVLLFILSFIAYVFCITQIRYELLLYLVLDVIIYLILKSLYKAKITDFFLIIVLDLYLFICSIGCYLLIKNYLLALVIYRIILFIPLIFKDKLINLYKEYCKLWNRHNIKGKLKSITIRNIVLVLFHIMIVIFHLGLVYITTIG